MANASKGKLTKKTKSQGMSRAEIIRAAADQAGVSVKNASAVISSLAELLHREMGKKGSGYFILSWMGIKVRRVKKAATKARAMKSPLTGTDVIIPAKPSHVKVKLSALKRLREAISR